MKTLANCAPREFLYQTNRIRKRAERWLSATRVMEIRTRLPEDLDDPEAVARQVRENAAAVLDAALEAHPEETAELLGLLCFIEPEDLDRHPMAELLGGLAELLQCREVVDFFISLARLARRRTANAVRA